MSTHMYPPPSQDRGEDRFLPWLSLRNLASRITLTADRPLQRSWGRVGGPRLETPTAQPSPQSRGHPAGPPQNTASVRCLSFLCFPLVYIQVFFLCMLHT